MQKSILYYNLRKGTCLLLLLIISCISCQRQQPIDQGKSEACWIYAMLACIEIEQRNCGDSVTLSRQWLLTRSLEEQTRHYFLIMPQLPPSQREQGWLSEVTPLISARGVGPEALQLIEKYGLVPYDMERSEVLESRVLQRKLAHAAETSQSLHELESRMEDLLPRFTLSADSNAFFLYSMQYTPHQFAESIMYHQHWQWYTSVPYQPYNTSFPLAVIDNHRQHEYLNLPIDQLTQKVIASLEAGHPVYWEYGHPLPSGGNSSDHAVAIVAMQKDKNGKPLLRYLNSYGSYWGDQGYGTVSLEQFRKTTCNVGILIKHN